MSSNKDQLVTAKNLSKTYPRKKGPLIKALDGISLDVFRGEFLSIIGHSGSGKTTLLNLVGALDRPTSGEIFFEGKNLASLSPFHLAALRRQKIGFIFQTFNLIPSLTVRENVESALVHSGMKRAEIDRKVITLFEDLKLVNLRDRFPLELSAGQQQKVAIARAIVKEPILILADEPTGEMDPTAGKEILEKLIELNRKSKITVIFASHGISSSESDRTIFIDNGRLVSQKEAGY